MKIVYMGTPDFALAPLKALLGDSEVEVIGVVTNKDKPVGRKQVLTPPPVKVLALENNIPVFQFDKIRNEGVEDLRKLAPDFIVTCAFGQILSQEIIDIPKFGVINIHASLLPKYRGASPIHYAILKGEEKTGITIMRTDIGIDTGDIILQSELEMTKNETCGELFERLSVLGAELIVDVLKSIEKGKASFTKQNDELATYSRIIKKEDALIDFNNPANVVINQIRAFNPSPVAYTFLDGVKFKIFSAEECEFIGCPGEILQCENKLVVACKKGAISITKIQKEGGKPLLIADFLRGNKIEKGKVFSKC